MKITNNFTEIHPYSLRPQNVQSSAFEGRKLAEFSQNDSDECQKATDISKIKVHSLVLGIGAIALGLYALSRK